VKELLVSKRRLLVIGPTEVEAISGLSRPFVMLLVAGQKNPDDAQKQLIDSAVASGCVEFCCIGDHSEALHDYIDSVLEDRCIVDVVTTWHNDEPLEEALFYFAKLAGARPSTLVAAVDGDAAIVNGIRQALGEHNSLPNVP
jgi:hypothetical protein